MITKDELINFLESPRGKIAIRKILGEFLCELKQENSEEYQELIQALRDSSSCKCAGGCTQ
jgi:hypothetical protein